MDAMNRLFRSALLALAGNRAVEAFALKYGLRLGANKFVAGETREQALAQVRAMNAKGVTATLDHLGEGVRRLAEASAYKAEYLRLLADVAASGVNANVSLKPTQMGLELDRNGAYANIREIVSAARLTDCFVRIDMENSPYTTATLDFVRRLHAEGLDNVGAVIQAYLYRSEQDVRELTAAGVGLRLVKGAYKEPRTIAYPAMEDVNENFRKLIAIRLKSGVYTGVATHDEAIIAWTKKYAWDNGVPRNAFEFQMLYGVRTQLQEQLAREGYRIRCYVPYGRMWYPYFVRRLAERPANVLFILKNVRKR